MQQVQLQKIIQQHQEWLNTEGESGQQAILENANLSLLDFSGLNLSGIILIGANLNRANLSDCNLSNADLRKVNLNYANLFNANLSQANLSYVSAEGANFTKTNLSGAIVDHGIFNYALLRKADLSYSKGKLAIFDHCDFGGANLIETSLENTSFAASNFLNASLNSSSLRQSTFTNARGLWFHDTVLANDRIVSGAMRPEYEYSNSDRLNTFITNSTQNVGIQSQNELKVLYKISVFALLFAVFSMILGGGAFLYSRFNPNTNVVIWLIVSGAFTILGHIISRMSHRLGIATKQKLHPIHVAKRV